MHYTPALHSMLFVALLSSSACHRPAGSPTKGAATADGYQKAEQQGDTEDLRQGPGQGPVPEGTPARLTYEHGIRSILEDSHGNLWIGSHQEGVCRFDGERFTYFTVKDGLSHNQVRTIQEDRNGTLWFETGNGITSYDGQTLTTHTDKDYDSKNDWKADTSDLWFKGDEMVGYNELEGQPGAYRYDGRKLSYLTFPRLEPSDDTADDAASNTGEGGEMGAGYIDGSSDNYFSVTTSAVRGKSGTLWFGTYGAVIGYDGNGFGGAGHDGPSFTIINTESLGLSEETGSLHIRSLFADRAGNLWIGNNGIGLLLYDGETTINFTEQQGLSKQSTNGQSPSLHRVFSIGQDAAGNMWFGTVEYGAWRYDGTSLTNFTAKDGLASKHIWSIYTDSRGDLLLGGADPSGVFKFNGKSFDQMH